jgi:DNA-binding CsgD family transcriptional regulator
MKKTKITILATFYRRIHKDMSYSNIVRDRKIFKLLSKGRTPKEIAAKFFLSVDAIYKIIKRKKNRYRSEFDLS